MRAHPYVFAYVAGMVICAAVLSLSSKFKAEATLADGRVLNLQVVNALFWGILWPVFLLFWIPEMIWGQRKVVETILGKNTPYDYFWSHPTNPQLKISGFHGDYPIDAIKDGEQVLHGRIVSQPASFWGVLLLEHKEADAWRIVCKSKQHPDKHVEYTFDSGLAAWNTFRTIHSAVIEADRIGLPLACRPGPDFDPAALVRYVASLSLPEREAFAPMAGAIVATLSDEQKLVVASLLQANFETPAALWGSKAAKAAPQDQSP